MRMRPFLCATLYLQIDIMKIKCQTSEQSFWFWSIYEAIAYWHSLLQHVENEIGPAKLHPWGKVGRVITSAFITTRMVDCILYCSGTDRLIYLHWLSYSL